MTEVAGEDRLATIQRDIQAFQTRNQQETEKAQRRAKHYAELGSQW